MKGPMKLILPAVIFLSFAFYLFRDKQQKIDFSTEHTAIMLAIDEEIQYLDAIGDSSHTLSDSLIMRISILANSSKPSEVIDKASGIEKKLSPERGILLNSLVNKKLNTKTYKKIFQMTTFEYAFLEEADLSNAPLDRILLNQSFFKNVNLSKASLVNANLFNAHFKNVNLRSANLHIANLREINLDGSNLTKTNMESAYLIDAKFAGTQMEGAVLDGANLAGVNLAYTSRRLGNNN
ncbi:MAG: pentapeptide repeat-containing protein [Saprospiraceae bacterium]